MVAHEGHRADDGRANRCAVPRPLAEGEGDRLPRRVEKHHVHYVNPRTLEPSEMDFNYYSAVNSVKNSLAKVKDEKGMKRLEKYLKEGVCPDRHGTRLSEAARAPRLRGNRSGPGNGNDAFGTDPLGAGHAGIASERDAPHGAEHLRIVHGRFRAVDGSRPWISVA